MFFKSTPRSTQVAAICLIALLALSWLSPAATSTLTQTAEAESPADSVPLPGFDLRQTRRPARVNLEQKKRLLRFEPAALDSVVLRWNDQIDAPYYLFSQTGPLTAPSSDDAVVIARRFVQDNDRLFRITQTQLEQARVSALEPGERRPFTRVALEQRLHGIRVFDSEMLFIIDRQGRVVSESGSFIPEIEGVWPEATPALAAEEALDRAARFCGAELIAPVSVVPDNLPARRRVIFSSHQIDSRSEASLVYYPVSRGEVRLAYQVLLYGVPRPFDAYLVVVDAKTGELLRRDSLSFALDAAPQGRVFIKENPVISGDREMVTLAGDAQISPKGWLAGPRTEGNNTAVYYNPDGTAEGGDLVGANSDGSFDFPLDLGPGRSVLEFFKASAANLFYWVNLTHDRFYALGFDENSRNFQVDNFDRGGRGGDPIRADTLRGAMVPNGPRNNAFFATSLDGTQPLLAMLLWVINGGELDSSYDAGVIIHEFTHGVSTRLTGTDNSIGLRSTQGGGMGEGWSDFFAMSFLTGTDRPITEPVSAGSYLTQRPRGVRVYAYTPDFSVNPLTLGDIQFNSAVHSQGTVWCTILWEMRQALIERYGFDTGKRTAEQLAVDGLKFTPIAPLFTDARDAILLADRTANGGANQDLIWRAFARRGLGASAATNLPVSPTGFRLAAREAYDLPPSVTAGQLVIDDKPPAPAVIGETLPVVVVDRDLLSSDSVDVRATTTRTGATAIFALARTAPGRFAGSLRVAPPEVDGGPGPRIVARPGDEIVVAYDNARNGLGGAETLEVRTTAGLRLPVYAVDFERGAPDWTFTSLWHLTQRRAASPTQSVYFAQQKGAAERKSFTPNGSSGSIYSPEIDARGLLQPRLEFDQLFMGALQGDQAFPAGDLLTLTSSNYPLLGTVTIPLDDSRLQVIFDARPRTDANFSPTTVDLRFIENRRAYLRFSFLASRADIKRKGLEGFYLDNVRITAVATR